MNEYLLIALALFFYFSLWFLVSLFYKRNDVADLAWGLGFALVVIFSFFLYQSSGWRPLLVNLLIIFWGMRLAFHIFKRLRRKKEDPRYAIWKEKWGKWIYLRSYLQVFLLQGFLLFLIVFPAVFLNKRNFDNQLTLFDILGFSFWLVGFFFEAVSDWQLSQFLKNIENKGKIMQTGLWKFSRHPNYFGEVLMWWGIYFFAVSLPFGWQTIFSPLTITFLLLFISGIPLLEKKYALRPDYEEYKKRTSIFLPLPPKKI